MQPLVPKRVRDEVERYLRCGDVRYGFVEATCGACDDTRLVALRCRSRGWCPSCTTRRALEAGLQLEEELARVTHRQWTLSLPMSARFQVVKQPALLKSVEVRLVQAVWRQQRATGKRLGMRGPGPLHGGAVCFWQYFGSSLQLTPHLHLAGARSAVNGLGRGGDVAAARRRSGSTRSREAICFTVSRPRRCAASRPTACSRSRSTRCRARSNCWPGRSRKSTTRPTIGSTPRSNECGATKSRQSQALVSQWIGI